MTFLSPVAGLVAAAIAVPLLIALYLLKLRRRTLRVSSTLLWEQSVKDIQANVPFRWLRLSLPLMLQLLGLIALLIALARPAIPSDSPLGQRVVIVIDRSASMSAMDGVVDGGVPGAQAKTKPTRLDQAKQRALRVVDDLAAAGASADGTRPRAMVIALAAQARVVCSFSDDVRDVRDAINAITPTDQPGNIQSVWPLVRAALAGEAGAEENAKPASVLVFTDGNFEDRASPGLPGSVRVTLMPAGPLPVPRNPGVPAVGYDNLALVALGAQRDPASPATVRVFVRVTNSDLKARATTAQARAADGALLGSLTLQLPAASRQSDGRLIAGEAAGTIEFSRPDAGLITVSLPEADLLSADNSVGFSLAPMARPRVVVVGPGAETDRLAPMRGEQGVDRALLAALREMDLGSVRVMNADMYRAEANEAASESGGLGAGSATRAFGGVDLIIFDRVMPERVPAVPTISIGAGLPIPEIRVEPAPIAQSDDAQGSRVASTRIISWRRTHPILKYAPLDSVLIAPPMRMTIVESEAPSTAREITPLAFGTSGPLIALVEEPGIAAPKRLVLAMDLLRTNWGPEVSFPVFFASAIEFLSGRGESSAARSFTTAQALTVTPPPGAKRLVLIGPMRIERDLAEPSSLAASPDTAGVSVGIPERVGAYTIEGSSGPGSVACVNLLDANESLLDIRPRAFESNPTTTASPGDPAAKADAPLPLGVREIWPIFVLGALVLLSIEWFVYAWRMRA